MIIDFYTEFGDIGSRLW